MRNKTDIDYLLLYRGKSIVIPSQFNGNDIVINVPTLEQICEYGESKYYGMVHTLCSVGIDLCWQLDEIGIDFEEISDFQLFYSILIKNLTVEKTSILFGNQLDLSKMVLYLNKDNNAPILVQNILQSIPMIVENTNYTQSINIPDGAEIKVIEQSEKFSRVEYNGQIGYIASIYIVKKENEKYYISGENDKELIGNGIYEHFVIDENVYYQIVEYLRAMHSFKRDDRIAGTRSCKLAFIEDAKMEYEAMKLEPKKSILLSMISTMVNSNGFKRNDKTIWDMNIFAFMDSVYRVSKIKNADLLLQSGYSGFGIDLQKIDKNEINYIGELNM